MATLVMGIGGVGKVVLMKLRRMIVEEYGELKDDISFLHVDTFNGAGQEGAQDFSTKVLGIDITLGTTERLVLSRGLPCPPHTKTLAESPVVKEWFPRDLPLNVDFAQGAGGVRAYGRLAFHHKIEDFRSGLNQKLNAGQGEAEVNIYIVCSLFGGTGSGSFLDACYMTRDMKQQLGLRGEIVGFFVIGAINPDAIMQTNCYAALTELEYYTTENLREAKGRPFEARYPIAGVAPLAVGQPPVDTCYLIGTNNGRRIFNRRSDLEEMVARRIFLESIPGIRQPMVGKRVDIKGTLGYYTLDIGQKKARTFFATGCSLIEFPAPRLMNGLGAALAACCAQYMLYENADGFKDLKGTIKDVIENRLGSRITDHALKSELEKEDTRTVGIAMKEDRFRWLASLRDRIREGAIKEGTLHSDAEDIVNRAVDSIGEKSAHILTIHNNMESIWNRIELTISDYISSLVVDSNIGPSHSVTFVDALMNELKSDLSLASKTHKNTENIVPRLRERVNRRLNRIKEDETYRWEVGKHIEWLCTRELAAFMEQGLRKSVYECMTTFFNRVMIKLGDTRVQIENYKKQLTELRDAFAGEAGEVCRNLTEWVRAEGGNVPVDGAGDAPAGVDQRVRQAAHPGGNHLNHLGSFLASLAKMEKPGDMTGLYGVFSILTTGYGILDPFGGNIERTVRTIANGQGNAFAAMKGDAVLFKRNLFMACRNAFNGLRAVNLCDLLNDSLGQEVRDSLFGERIDWSQWFLEVSTDDPTIEHVPALHDKKWVGVPNGIDLNHHPVWNGLLGQFNANTQRFNAVQEPYRMVFATEASVFCLRNVSFIANYATQFRGLSPQDRKRSHTHEGIEFPDIMPPDPRIAEIIERAERAELLGKIFAFLEEARDPETHFNAIYLHYSDPTTGTKMNEKLCERWDDAVNTLKESQIKKEIDRAFAKNTSLEILNAEIDRFAKARKTREEKAELYAKTTQYTKEFVIQMGGDEGDIIRHPAYQKMVRIINEFLKQYQIQSAI